MSPNIEKIESGPSFLDKTADEYYEPELHHDEDAETLLCWVHAWRSGSDGGYDSAHAFGRAREWAGYIINKATWGVA